MRNATLYTLDTEGILLCHKTRRLFYLNGSAALLWSCLEHGQEADEVARAIAARFGISISVARRDVFSLLSNWEREGLRPARASDVFDRAKSETTTDADGELDTTEASVELSGMRNAQPVPHPPRQTAESAGVFESVRMPSEGRPADWYAIGDVTLRVVYHTMRSKLLVHPILEHFASSLPRSGDTTLVTLEIRDEQQGFSLSVNGSDTLDRLQPLEVPPVVQAEVLRANFHAARPLVGIHGAALCTPTGCLVLPGAPGSGKSTLAAALMAEGHTYLTDELVLIMPGTHVIRPLPVSLGLKPGSWRVLSEVFPTIETLPTFRQLDGTEVRYLAPVPTALPSGVDYAARTLVFPVYDPNGNNELLEISTADALYRLAAAGYALPGRLEHNVVEALIEWMRPLSCYDLRISSLGAAVSAVDGVMA